MDLNDRTHGAGRRYLGADRAEIDGGGVDASFGVGEDDRAWTHSAAIARTATAVAATGMRQR